MKRENQHCILPLIVDPYPWFANLFPFTVHVDGFMTTSAVKRPPDF